MLGHVYGSDFERFPLGPPAFVAVFSRSRLTGGDQPKPGV
jgi:hypothetical protein